MRTVGTLIFPVFWWSAFIFATAAGFATARGAPGFAAESAPSIASIAVLPDKAALKITRSASTRAE